MPNISICIPAYNAAAFLEETLASIVAQTYENWELILVEDGSDDGTREILARYSEFFSQPQKYLRHDVNRGLSETRNTCIQHARGQWLAWIDQDDLWAPDHLCNLVETQHATSADLVWSTARVFDTETGETLYLREAPEGIVNGIGEQIYRDQIVIQPSSVLFRRSLVAQIGGFDANYPMCNDKEYWLRAARAGIRFAGVSRATCHYRKHGAAMSSKSVDLIAEGSRVKLKQIDWLELPRSLRITAPAIQLFHAARIARRSSPLKAIQLLFEAIAFLLYSTVVLISQTALRWRPNPQSHQPTHL